MDISEKFMRRCFDLALKGFGKTAPNPMVGCVIVYDGKIIGEGYHKQYGEAHAEVNAINAAVRAHKKTFLKRSILYVNLEPCAHFGKTPPCSDFIIKHKIPCVVVGCEDPFPKVEGRGIKKLKNAGCKVFTGMLEKEARELNRRFYTFHVKKRPYILLKWAQTSDGFIAGKNLHERWISNDYSLALVHKWRSREQSVMVGSNTALLDDPQLNVRKWKGRNPLRIVLDRAQRLPPTLHLFDRSSPTTVFTAFPGRPKHNLEYIPITSEGDIIRQVLNWLVKRDIQSLIVEGGAKLLNYFIKKNIWDEARVFISDKNFQSGLKAPEISVKPVSEENICNDRLLVYAQRT